MATFLAFPISASISGVKWQKEWHAAIPATISAMPQSWKGTIAVPIRAHLGALFHSPLMGAGLAPRHFACHSWFQMARLLDTANPSTNPEE